MIVSSGNDIISCPDGNASIRLNVSPLGSPAPNRVVFLGSGGSQVSEVANTLQGSGTSRTKSVIVVGSAAATINSQLADQIWMQDGGGVVVGWFASGTGL